MNKKILVFDIWGDYAHFKKYYTTSSPLTFSVPPRTAIIGLIGAIIGLKKDEYLELMKKKYAKVGIRILNPIRKTRIGINLIDTKGEIFRPVKRGNLTGRTQIKFEFVKQPKYRIYFTHTDNKIYNTMKNNLCNHKCYYTPYLGLSELIANFNFSFETEIIDEVKNTNLVEVNTLIPSDLLVDIELEENKKYFKERIPTEMLPGRVVTEYREVIYEIEGKPIKVKIKKGLKLENGEIITIL